MRINPVNSMYADIFSIFNPVIKEVMVVAILLPNIMPMLLLNVNILAFIKEMVKSITADDDWIIDVAKKPVLRLFNVEEVIEFNFCFTLCNDIDIRFVLR